jgi:hypothetical protein
MCTILPTVFWYLVLLTRSQASRGAKLPTDQGIYIVGLLDLFLY